MKKIISLLLALCFLSFSPVVILASTAKIEIDGENQYKALRLTPQIYNAANSDLSDLLLKNSKGETVPYFIYRTKMGKEDYFIESLAPKFTTQSFDKNDKKTDIMIDGLKNMRLHDVTIDTDSMFKRTITIPNGRTKEIYNLSLNGVSEVDTTISLGGQIAYDDTYVMTIDDADDKPINVNNITVRYYADELVFEGKAGEVFTLEFGEDPTKTAPVYDIERYKDEILKGTIDRVAISEIDDTTAKKAVSTERDYKFLFNIVIITITLLLGVVILVKLKRT